eukprot:7384040-Prymnesium_polylepis.1
MQHDVIFASVRRYHKLPDESPVRTMEPFPTQETISILTSFIQESKCITWTGRTANAALAGD